MQNGMSIIIEFAGHILKQTIEVRSFVLSFSSRVHGLRRWLGDEIPLVFSEATSLDITDDFPAFSAT